MTLYNQHDDYFKGFLVGTLTTLTLGGTAAIIVSLINYLPELYRIIGLVVFGLSLPFWFARLLIRTERFIRTKFEKANPKLMNSSFSDKETRSKE